MFKYHDIIWIFCFLFIFTPLNAKELRLATTSSTKSSGLLEKLVPVFEQASGYKMKIYAVGTGKALKMGRKGEVDVLMVHAPNAEKKFVQEGYGLHRTSIMKNDFVIIGPKTDPAGINNLKVARRALQIISQNQSLFISRADDGGTHKKEMNCWEAANVTPYGDWYFELGGSMGEAMSVANEKQAYLLVDRGSWLANRSMLSLVLHVEGDPMLDNPYAVIAVNPKKHKGINYSGAKKFIQWISSKQGLEIIKGLKVGEESLYTITLN